MRAPGIQKYKALQHRQNTGSTKADEAERAGQDKFGEGFECPAERQDFLSFLLFPKCRNTMMAECHNGSWSERRVTGVSVEDSYRRGGRETNGKPTRYRTMVIGQMCEE